MRTTLWPILISGAMLLCGASSASCPPAGLDREALQAMASRRFEVADAADRRAIALALVDCLGDPDPVLRDGVAYTALAQWMRAGGLDTDTLRALRDHLQARVDAGEGDGFARPFAALALSEVARTDRISPWMTADERDAMVGKAATYLATVQDYRGFDNDAGWRHGVAHGADWLLQLALNPSLDRTQGDRILAAVAVQAVPEAGHAYVFGEPDRLARPVLALARTDLYAGNDWQAWFASLPPRLGEAGLAYADEHWLGRRHDLVAFLLRLHFEAGQGTDARLSVLMPAIKAALDAMP